MMTVFVLSVRETYHDRKFHSMTREYSLRKYSTVVARPKKCSRNLAVERFIKTTSTSPKYKRNDALVSSYPGRLGAQSAHKNSTGLME